VYNTEDWLTKVSVRADVLLCLNKKENKSHTVLEQETTTNNVESSSPKEQQLFMTNDSIEERISKLERRVIDNENKKEDQPQRPNVKQKKKERKKEPK